MNLNFIIWIFLSIINVEITFSFSALLEFHLIFCKRSAHPVLLTGNYLIAERRFEQRPEDSRWITRTIMPMVRVHLRHIGGLTSSPCHGSRNCFIVDTRKINQSLLAQARPKKDARRTGGAVGTSKQKVHANLWTAILYQDIVETIQANYFDAPIILVLLWPPTEDTRCTVNIRTIVETIYDLKPHYFLYFSLLYYLIFNILVFEYFETLLFNIFLYFSLLYYLIFNILVLEYFEILLLNIFLYFSFLYYLTFNILVFEYFETLLFNIFLYFSLLYYLIFNIFRKNNRAIFDVQF